MPITLKQIHDSIKLGCDVIVIINGEYYEYKGEDCSDTEEDL